MYRTFWRISRNAKKYRGWVQIRSTRSRNENRIKAKKRDKQMQVCTHLSRFALVSRVFPGRCAKKYTGYCIIACVPMWLRGKDLNQRPPGYGFAPPCRSCLLRAGAETCPQKARLRKKRGCCIRPRRRSPTRPNELRSPVS